MDDRSAAQPSRPGEARILLVTATAAYRHQSIPTVWRALPEIAESAGDLTVATILKEVDDLPRLTAEMLADHEILCLVHTSGELPFSDEQKQAILAFVSDGGGFVGVHGATTICYDWTEYGEMLGAQFDRHPPAASFTVQVDDGAHPSTRHLPPSFTVRDELYTFRAPLPDSVDVLLRAEAGSLNLEGDLPLAWAKTYGEGRVYYNSLGHFDIMWDEQPFQEQIRAALLWSAHLDA